MFIIEVQNQDFESQYVCRGEYTEFELSPSFQRAKMFDTLEQAKTALQSNDFTKRNVFTDGSSSPPHILWSGLGICNARREATGQILIKEVKFEDVYSQEVSDKLL